ncbi:glycosyltransferase family 4 protein [Trueperella bialowiezensis]|uniref:PEP-CTERM/exosortase A-associated glycosyltransferase, Daro_2409 family n=1 Tax=Trueperella bialowiezensis TaxID=312285 RepID=A0A3S4VSS8_9ACTO|nr:glycosyltransferase family 4 protein [Trueperella bialowiezensis]VEI12926.1 PEP-CTERM/exosortase A-associated glycosyltransferase, Daro_2409 family [Trueperella bialowiezensis]
MKVAIASRIFMPEPAAASFRLAALAQALHDTGHDVEVLTVTPPAGMSVANPPYMIRRSPVIRDSNDYVRGYIPYLSFDIPLFFRLLRRRYDVVVIEPPPTTGFVGRLANALKRTPYVYYAADVWADAATQTEAPTIVTGIVRAIEKFAWNGAAAILSVSEGVESRLTDLGVRSQVVTVGNGVAADDLARGLPDPSESGESFQPHHAEFVYAGTASEWHGADIFVEALAQIVPDIPDARIRFIGGGSQHEIIREKAKKHGIEDHISIEPVLPPDQLAPILYTSTAALASVLPGVGYDFAFPTKLYSAAVCGAPLVYAGIGPGREFVNTQVSGLQPLRLGTAADYDVADVAQALWKTIEEPRDTSERNAVSQWARDNVSLNAVARRAVTVIEDAASAKSKPRSSTT